jgi:tetratricopeptide (TPR) repeat protein
LVSAARVRLFVVDLPHAGNSQEKAMIARHWFGFAVLLPLLLGARTIPTADVDALLRAGNAAFERGDYAEAAEYYDRAGERALEPGLVAFNLATAKYHLARDGNSQALADAEQAYRCCLEKGDPRRAQALFGLGNCLLLRAAGSTLDRVALRSAIDRFAECLRDPGCDAVLAADARYNRLRARLLLLQAPLPQDGSDDDSGRDDSKDDPQTDDKQPDGGRGGIGDEKGDRSAIQGKGAAEQAGGTPEGAPAPGRGTLPPVPDRSESAPLSATDALAHLEQATERILKESREHRRGRARPSGTGVRDW